MLRRAEKNHRMSAFALADIVVPKDFHEIAGLRLRKIGKVPAEPELVKQTRGAGTVRVPASPNAFTIVLIANDELVESCVVKLQLAAVAQHFDGLNKDDVGRARAKTGIRRSWITKNFPDSKCAADSSLILAKCEIEYLPPVGILLTCWRISVL